MLYIRAQSSAVAIGVALFDQTPAGLDATHGLSERAAFGKFSTLSLQTALAQAIEQVTPAVIRAAARGALR